MTELTETKQAPETIEEVALSIVVRGLPFSAFRNGAERQNVKAWLQAEIISALRNERERCAKIADRWANARSCEIHSSDPCCHVRTGARIAEVIRKGE